VSPCVGEKVFRAADSEAFKGTWSFDLVRTMRQETRSSTKLERFEYPEFVMGPEAQLQRELTNPAPMAISRPAVNDRKALVHVQFGNHYAWLVLLSLEDSGWKVVEKVPIF